MKLHTLRLCGHQSFRLSHLAVIAALCIVTYFVAAMVDKSLQQRSPLESRSECRLRRKGEQHRVFHRSLGTSPQRVHFNDTCLERVIRSYCFDSGLRVPRVLHYVSVNATELPFFWLVGALSAVRFLQPCLVLFHGDDLPFGPHWEALLQLVPYVIHVDRDVPTSIFGNRIQNIHHRTDVIRLEALTKYGGLYLDSDEWVLQPLDDLRRFPVTLGVEINGSRICNAMIMAEPNATFINRWYQSYRTFNDSWWVKHSGMIPYKMALKLPEEVHLDHRFFTPTFKNMRPLYQGHYDWWNNRGVHLYRRFNAKYFRGRIQDRNTSLGEMTRHILFGSRNACLGQQSPNRSADEARA